MAADFTYAVVGAGMIGAAAARHLALGGARVAIVGPPEPPDRATHDGIFASHYDEARITRTIDADPVWARLAHRSIGRYRAIEDESGIAFHSDVGCLIAGPAGPDGAVAQALDAAERLGAAATALSAEACAVRFPFLTLPRDSAAVWEAHGAGHINPRRLVAAQLRLAVRGGAVLIPEITRSVRETGAVAAIETTAGRTLAAEKVLVAAGGFTNARSLLPKPLDLNVYARTVAFFGIDEAAARRLASMPSLIALPDGAADTVYLLPPVRYPDGRLYLKIGGDPQDIPLDDDAEIRSWFRGDGSAAARAWLTDAVHALVTGLPAEPAVTAPCVTTYTPTDRPAIGHVSDRITVATGGCGRAAKSSDEIGRLAAGLLQHGRILDPAYDADFAPRLR